jgi:hypothetical protein
MAGIYDRTLDIFACMIALGIYLWYCGSRYNSEIERKIKACREFMIGGRKRWLS